MTKKMGKAALLFFAGAMALTSCNRETDLYNPYATMEDYSNNWNDKFGNVDENQDWNMAEKVTATFNLSEITNDECSVNIYSKSPLKEGCILLASTTVKGNGSISFDMAESEGLVYVKIDNAHGNIISGYYDVVERTITVGKPATRATGDCNTTQGDILAIEHDPYQDPNDPSIWLNRKQNLSSSIMSPQVQVRHGLLATLETLLAVYLQKVQTMLRNGQAFLRTM